MRRINAHLKVLGHATIRRCDASAFVSHACAKCDVALPLPSSVALSIRMYIFIGTYVLLRVRKFAGGMFALSFTYRGVNCQHLRK